MKVYFCIDLKSFFASVECVERKLDPFTTNLVVADSSRGKGTICLAITPHMKLLGIKNRCRIYEIPQNVKFIAAKPRMSKYIEYSANIYAIYLKYFSKDDIHVYSIDEAFIDVTDYLHLYNMHPLALAKKVMNDIYQTVGITATCGIGTNLYLTKIALDIMSKHNADNIGILNEEKYREKLWHHKKLTDFWQIGTGIERRLNKMNLFDMYDVAHCKEEKLYKEFGVNAELLIDHAWGRESCTIADIKRYKPKSNSISNSQILFKDYNFQDAKIVMIEMVELLSLKLIENNLLTSQIHLYIGYSKDVIPASNCSRRLFKPMNTYSDLVNEYVRIYETSVSKVAPIRRIGISFGGLEDDRQEQLSLFENIVQKEKEREIEKTINYLKLKLGKNSIIRAMDLQENATTIIRNKLIGGHNGE